MSETTPNSLTKTGYRDFTLILLGLTVIQSIVRIVNVPAAIRTIVDILILVAFFIFTIFAIFRAMSEVPKPKIALIFLLIGTFIKVLTIYTLAPLLGQSGLIGSLVGAVGNAGLMIACIGLGALIASLLREKNIMIPVGMFLIAYDYFLVLAPMGFVQRSLKSNPSLFTSMALSVPKTSTTTANASTMMDTTSAYIGPADLVFLGAFFLAMFRFDMRPKETLKWMVPTLIAYMVIVLVTHWNLPALVPIGLVTLIVNWKEFKLSKDEWASTIVLMVIMLSVLGFFAMQKPKLQPAPSPSATSSSIQGSANLPAQALPSQPRSAIPSAPQNTPNPP